MKLQTDEVNLPLKKSGVYGIVHTPTQRWYIGVSQDIAVRYTHYISLDKSSLGVRIRNALRKHNSDEFKFIPLFYQFSYDRKSLLEVETSLISSFNSVKNGFNIIEFTHGGYEYGEEFRKVCKVAHSKEGFKEKHSKAALIAYQLPGYREKHKNAIKESLAKPGTKVKQHQVLKALTESEEVKEKRKESLKRYLKNNPFIWITDGTSSRKLPKREVIPPGWKSGMAERHWLRRR